MVADPAFGFLRIGRYPMEKPRSTAMTIVIDGMDSGFLSRAQVASLGDFLAPYIDFVKLGWMIPRLTSRATLVDKIKAYHDVGIRVFFGGMAMEVALIQGKAADYVEACAEYGGDALEISASASFISPRVADESIRRAKAAGIKAFLEIGRKGEEAANPTVDDVRRQLDRMLVAGGDGLIVESERLESMHQSRTLEPFLEGCADLDLAKLIFELPYGLSFPKLQPIATRLFSVLGPDLNVANVEFAHVMAVATIRTGTCFGELFGLVPTETPAS
jgi:phosphosulfolactate synthase (CoM biosynthesis protein A)